MNAPRISVNMKTPDCCFAVMQPVLFETEFSGEVAAGTKEDAPCVATGSVSAGFLFTPLWP
jgi:hypothetical protein